MNGIIDKVKETVKKYQLLEPGDNVVAALSGGPDSLCMLHALMTLKEYFGINQIAAVHINHMYRGEDAFKDEKFSENFCRERGILFFVYRYDIEKLAAELKLSAEAAGRKVRYEAFREVAEGLGGAKIAVAHNREDQAETLLMRMVRGTGTDGLAGIAYRREGGVIRPLLACGRQEIEAYCREEGLKPQTDLTNLEPIYTRNVVRLKLIPYINEVMGGDIVNSLAELSEIAREDKDFFAGLTEQVMQEFRVENGRGTMSLERIQGLHPALRKRVILRCFGAVGLKTDIGSVHLENAERMILSDRTTGQIEFPHKYEIKKRYQWIFFEKVHEKDTTEFEFRYKIVDSEPDLSEWKKRNPEKQDTRIQYFDWEKVKAAGTPVLRYRRAGDVISPKGFRGTKKLKEYFIDRKIDRDLRDRLPLLCVGSQILWIYGYEVNEKFLPEVGTSAVMAAEIGIKGFKR